MRNKEFKLLWIISCFMLASLLCAGYVVAQDKDKPEPPIRRGAEQIISIFDEQAGDFEESNYTPPTDLEERMDSLKVPDDVRKYLSDKYQGLRKDALFSTLKQTQYGPEGDINLMFDIKNGWDSPNKKGESREVRAKSLARAYIEQEPGLFGVFDIGELKEIRINTDKGYGGNYTFIKYRRHINNVELKSWHLVITIGPDETVVGVFGKIVAPTPAFYQALAKRTIGKGKVFKVIREKLQTDDPEISVAISTAKKQVITDPPYAIWNVVG